jgi:hypothetical protein
LRGNTLTNKQESKRSARDEILKRMLKMPPKPHNRDLADNSKIAKQKPAERPKKRAKPK